MTLIRDLLGDVTLTSGHCSVVEQTMSFNGAVAIIWVLPGAVALTRGVPIVIRLTLYTSGDVAFLVLWH